jgi:hypothetical protein
MSKLFVNFLVFGIALQLVCYICWAFNLFNGLIQYPLGTADNINSLNSMFSMDWWSGLVGLAGVGISVAALLLRQGTYAVYALLLFALGVFSKIISGFILAIPNTVTALIASVGGEALNPTPGSTNPILIFIGAIVVFAGFMYFFGLVIQREAM